MLSAQQSHVRKRRRAPLSVYLCAVLATCAHAVTALSQEVALDVGATIRLFETSQRHLALAWSYEPGLVCAGAKVHGEITKQVNGSALASFIGYDASVAKTLNAEGVPYFSGMQVRCIE